SRHAFRLVAGERHPALLGEGTLTVPARSASEGVQRRGLTAKAPRAPRRQEIIPISSGLGGLGALAVNPTSLARASGLDGCWPWLVLLAVNTLAGSPWTAGAAFAWVSTNVLQERCLFEVVRERHGQSSDGPVPDRGAPLRRALGSCCPGP